MAEKLMENNQVVIMGTVVSDFTYSHEICGEAFYLVSVEVERLSEIKDVLSVMISERLVDVNADCKGLPIIVTGQFRSFNRHEDNRSHLVLSVFARSVEFAEEVEVSPKSNQICLEGFICKAPVYRETPLGREIADVLIAVNRPYGKSDYIPCICWGRTARFASNLSVGTLCRVYGRIQSREYTKKISEEQHEKRIAYEVSVSKVEVLKDEEQSD